MHYTTVIISTLVVLKYYCTSYFIIYEAITYPDIGNRYCQIEGDVICTLNIAIPVCAIF